MSNVFSLRTTALHSARIVQECASELSAPLAKLCNMSLRQGIFPSKWKQANIVPLHKKGDKRDPQNYRSVSLLSLFGKVIEKIVYDELLRHVAPVLSSSQHGFLPGRSCITNLTTFLHSAWGSISLFGPSLFGLDLDRIAESLTADLCSGA